MFALPRKRAPLHPLGKGLAAFTAALAIVVIPLGSKASAVGDSGPDTCLEGYTWRAAISTDHVCVTPATRSQAQADNAAAVSFAYATGQDPTVYVQAHMNALAANDHVCVTPTVRSQTATDNNINTWSPRVLTMSVYLSPYTAPVTLQGRGFNTGTAYVAVVRSSDNTVLWQTWISTGAGANFSVATPFTTCTQDTPSAPAYLTAYDYTAGVWRTAPGSEVC